MESVRLLHLARCDTGWWLPGRDRAWANPEIRHVIEMTPGCRTFKEIPGQPDAEPFGRGDAGFRQWAWCTTGNFVGIAPQGLRRRHSSMRSRASGHDGRG